MNEFKKLRKAVRRAAIQAGVVRRVARETGKTPATVSRTINGKVDCPDPMVVSAIRQFIAELNVAA